MKYRSVFLIFLSWTLFAQNSIVEQFSTAIADVAEKVNPAVVTIVTDKVIKLPMGNEFYFFFNPYQMPNGEREYKTNALGSGVIIDAGSGFVLTNNHVVEDMDAIRVKLIDKREFEAKVIGTDPKTDLAVLQIEADDLTQVKLGDSDKLRVGEWVMAVGSPFSENLSHTVTTGIVSALGRSNILRGQSYEDFIQTDAAINPGNSGGALLNMKGELIGINTAIATGGYERGNRGVGFAIPSNMANRIMADLIDRGYVVRAWLGVYIQALDSDASKALELDTRNGALVTQVVENSPAEKGGVKEGDVILYFNDQDITGPSNLRNIVSLTLPGTASDVIVFRDGRRKRLNVVLEELDNEQTVASRSNSRMSTLGLEVEELNHQLREKYDLKDSDGNLVIVGVQPESEAFEKNIEVGDIIKRVGTQQVSSLTEFKKKVKASEKKGTLLLLIKKPKGTSQFITLNF
ncbi:MAG: Do family serine endopeptidase [Candidatus Neomarinimicrobiota bacterium]|nr:Do family serine endopeptidase [Candidatus Neomarinimicrobiota bacterium]